MSKASNTKSHFTNGSVTDHLDKMKQTASLSKEEMHGCVLPFLHTFIQSGRHLAILLICLQSFFHFSYPELSVKKISLIFISVIFLIIRAAMETVKSWEILEFSHRTIEQERREIELNPEEEKEEVLAIYEAKGFKDELLEQITEYLTSDSNLLLNTMITEELELNIERFPHPLRQGLISLSASLPTLILFIPSLLLPKYMVSGIATGFIFALLSGLKAGSIGNSIVKAFVWNASIFTTILMTFYIFSDLFQ